MQIARLQCRNLKRKDLAVHQLFHIRNQKLKVFVELVQARRLASLVENWVIYLRIVFIIRRN